MSAPARSRTSVLWALVVSLAVAGVVLLTIALRAQVSAPTAHPAGRIDSPGPIAPGRSGPAPAARSGEPSPTRRSPSPLKASPPRTISVPAVGISSRINPIGLADDGTIAVPQPGPHLDEAAWFENSPTPGQPGPSVIEGHVDTEAGPSVFFELGKVRPGQHILVRRADGTRLTFTIDAVRDYLKSRFPTAVVYGAKDLSTPALRLITCSQFNRATGHHEGNQVVFAHLTHVAGQPPTS